jgi:hypothetical protein
MQGIHWLAEELSAAKEGLCSKELVSQTHYFTQAYSWGKVSILGGDSIDHCEKKVHVNECLILNGNQDRAVWISRPDSLRFLCVGLDEEQSLQKKGGYMTWIACFHFRSCCTHKETWRYTQMKNTWSYTHKLYSALMMMMGFLNIYCEL